MSDGNTLFVVEFSANPRPEAVRGSQIQHGDDLNGRNIAAVLEGDMCHSGCEWCDNLRRRCQSRRIA